MSDPTPHIPRINSFEPAYPSVSDAKKTARLRYGGSQYYFGKHGTPTSYITFGLWKHHLVSTGEPLKATALRPLARSILEQGVPPSPPVVTYRWFAMSVLAGALFLALATYQGLRLYSNFKPVKVDGIELTKSDITSVRASRLLQIANRERLTPEKIQARAAQLARELEQPEAQAQPGRYPPRSMDDFAKPLDKDAQNAIRITAKPPIP